MLTLTVYVAPAAGVVVLGVAVTVPEGAALWQPLQALWGTVL